MERIGNAASRYGGKQLMSYDADAQAYFTAVETADGQALETGVKNAINSFVVGCKTDGIWSAIKAACIMAGARTLSGALVPLVGPAPTSFNFVAGDYNRETGLLGNGSSKYLNSNRSANADPQNSHHLSVWVAANAGFGAWVASRSAANGVGDESLAAAAAINWPFRSRFSVFNTPSQGTRSTVTATGLIGLSRSNASNFVSRVSGSNETVLATSTTPTVSTYGVFARRRPDLNAWDSFNASRLSWYSIGEAINLASLDSRLSTLMTDLANPATYSSLRRNNAFIGLAF